MITILILQTNSKSPEFSSTVEKAIFSVMNFINRLSICEPYDRFENTTLTLSHDRV